MLAEAGTQESLASPLSKLHFCMARTAQKYNLKLNWYHPWHTLYKPDHYVLRVGDKSRIERFVGIAFLPELFGELFAGHDCLLRLCFHMCWDRTCCLLDMHMRGFVNPLEWVAIEPSHRGTRKFGIPVSVKAGNAEAVSRKISVSNFWLTL